ncbi:MAG: EVE domain-containing protein [Alcanivoracaceae bacterium]|nr:EVE domain-containing protein [Alcanivoracaceae bacterium]
MGQNKTTVTKAKQHWLFKSEPDEYGIDDLAREKKCAWEGIRNYQARNRLRDEVKLGDHVFIYHSSCAQPAVVGLAKVTREAYPDPIQFDGNSPYFDAKSDKASPRWLCVDIAYEAHLPTPITLKQIKQLASFESMELATRSRLSIQQVTAKEAKELLRMSGHKNSGT